MHLEALRAYFHLRGVLNGADKAAFTPAEAWRYAMAKHEGLRWRAQIAKLIPVRTDC